MIDYSVYLVTDAPSRYRDFSEFPLPWIPVTDIVFSEELPEPQLFATDQDALLEKLRKRQRICETLDRLKI